MAKRSWTWLNVAKYGQTWLSDQSKKARLKTGCKCLRISILVAAEGVSRSFDHPQSSIDGLQVARLSSSFSHLSSAAETEGDAIETEDRRAAWRWCLICSGTFPDRECELTPRHVTRGPGKMNCTRKYCTSHVRYEPVSSLVYRNDEGFKGNGIWLISKLRISIAQWP